VGAPVVFDAADKIVAAAGKELGSSDWLQVDQSRIDRFADATGDHQWIHVDPERAAAGPYGRTIAHGYLTLSLLPLLVTEIYRVDGASRMVNYGLDRVRFVSPVLVGSRIRARTVLREAVALSGGVEIRLETTIELEGHDRPACVAQTVSRAYFD
jgi:acyl dehydratase